MKSEMPEYMVPAEQNNQDQMEETATFIQETFEIIDDPRLDGKTQSILKEDGTITTATVDQSGSLNISDSSDGSK